MLIEQDRLQDVWSELGAPSSTAAKSTDSMLMQMRSGDAPGADYFYTYHSRSATSKIGLCWCCAIPSWNCAPQSSDVLSVRQCQSLCEVP